MEDYEHEEDEAGSRYSDSTPSTAVPQIQSNSASEDDGPPTPRANSPQQENAPQDPVKSGDRGSLPEFTGFLTNNDFGLSLQSYMTPSPPLPNEEKANEAPKMSEAQAYLQRPETPQERPMPTSRPDYDGSGWGPEEDDEFEVGTPDSVIRHNFEPSPARDSPSIPEQIATIKASSGSKLKTRPSATPSDLMAMRELRRNVSGEKPSIPPIPERHRNRPSLGGDRDIEDSSNDEAGVERQSSFKKRSLTLDIGNDLGLSLDKDFDRVIEAQKVAFDLSSSIPTCFNNNGQASSSSEIPLYEVYANITPRKQRGYLMRQNTKLVVASSDIDLGDDNRFTRSCGNSPVKKDRPQSWTVEPWNGQMRKNSVRDRASPRKKPVSGPAPPMPGQDSNVTGLGIVTEENSVADPVQEEGGERGRLFVKVIGVKDLDLPLPKSK